MSWDAQGLNAVLCQNEYQPMGSLKKIAGLWQKFRSLDNKPVNAPGLPVGPLVQASHQCDC